MDWYRRADKGLFTWTQIKWFACTNVHGVTGVTDKCGRVRRFLSMGVIKRDREWVNWDIDAMEEGPSYRLSLRR